MSQFFIGSIPGTPSPIQTLSGNDGVAVSPQANTIHVVGRGIVSSGISTAANLYSTGNNGAATITWNQTQAQQLTNRTVVTTTPYVVLLTDLYLSVNTTTAKTIQLPNAPATNRIFTIKDLTGSAATNPITVTTVGGAVTIDGATSILLNKAFQSIELVFNGTSYEIYSAFAEADISQLFTWSAKAAGTPLIPNQGYWSTAATAQSFLLPATCPAGQLIALAQRAAGIVTITQGAGQQIRFGNQISTGGASGNITATSVGDSITLLCTAVDQEFFAIAATGNWTIV